MDQEESVLKVDTAEIRYSEQGHAEPLLLVHGGVFAEWFLPMAAGKALQGFRVIRVRRAGYGDAPSPQGLIGLQDHARHLAMLLRSLKIPKAHVVGHSSGALIAMQLAANDPDLVQTFTLMEPAPVGPLQVPAFAELGERFVGPAMGAFSAGDVSSATDKFMLGVGGPDYREVIDRTLGPGAYAGVIRQSPFFFANEIPACMLWAFGSDDAAQVSSPVLVLEGAEGRRTGDLSQQVTEAALKLFPQAEVALIEHTNHLLPLQDPEAVGEIVARFARRHSLS